MVCILHSRISSVNQKHKVYSSLESGTLKQFTEAEGDKIESLIGALLSFKENARLFGSNRSKLNVKTENMLLTYQREVDGEIDSMLVHLT